MKRDIERLLNGTAHLVTADQHHCRFGDSYQPNCLDCEYVGPFVTAARAHAIAMEHSAKSAGEWEPAR